MYVLPACSAGAIAMTAAKAAASRASIMPTWPSAAEIPKLSVARTPGARESRSCIEALLRSSVRGIPLAVRPASISD